MGNYAGQRRRPSSTFGWIKFALLGVVLSIFLQGVSCDVEPTESQCRPYIEKALKEQHIDLEERNLEEAVSEDILDDQESNPPTDESTDSTESSFPKNIETEDDDKDEGDGEVENNDDDAKSEGREGDGDDNEDDGKTEEDDGDEETKEDIDVESQEGQTTKENDDEDNGTNVDTEEQEEEVEKVNEDDDKETEVNQNEVEDDKDNKSIEEESGVDDEDSDPTLERPIDIEFQEIQIDDDDDDDDDEDKKEENQDDHDDKDDDDDETDEKEKIETDDADDSTATDEKTEEEEADDTGKDDEEDEKDEKDENDEKTSSTDGADDEDERTEREIGDGDNEDDQTDSKTSDDDGDEKESKTDDDDDENADRKTSDDSGDGGEEDEKDVEDVIQKTEIKYSEKTEPAESEEAEDVKEDSEQESTPEEELINEVVIPENLRDRDHISKILKLEESETETTLEKAIDTTLKSLKGLYDSAIKPLEMLYKYRDLSNRHFGDPEIFSKPLILFMGPWSGGKSSTINYLLDNEYSHTSLRTGAEPSPAYFNILMHGEEEEILDGTQLAADWTFSGLQKFGQSLLDRLRGIKLPNKLLEKVNIVEIPGILEIRKQVQRLFPFNDACQWFIDRADIIFLVYDPSKLDVGPETEAILDQLKGREYQTRIILNKADQVKPEELMRVQGTLIWNISPLMSSSEPPIMYSTSLWSMPYEPGAPTRLLLAQERAFLRDLKEAIDKRVENKIASARRFAVRVRNHAKMVDCYLTTYYNHKTIFGNRKKISDDIIEYPQKYHIYEGLSTLTNISRYDLPDPDVYRDFFKINPLYDFQKLSETCTYFRGCPINKLDVAIAYDLPELVGKYRKAVEAAKEQLQKGKS